MEATFLLAECYQGNGDFKDAARTLSSFKFDDQKNARCEASPQYRFTWHVATCTNCLQIEDDAGYPDPDVGAALRAINKARVLEHEIDKSTDGYLEFKSLFARVKDYS